MSLLFDENLSRRLIGRLEAAYPQSEHVELSGSRGGPTWNFRQLSFLRGHPPKVIWLNVGNAGTDAIAELLAAQRERVQAFLSDPEASLLILDLPMHERG